MRNSDLQTIKINKLLMAIVVTLFWRETTGDEARRRGCDSFWASINSPSARGKLM